MTSIGRLDEVDVRELWKHEQYDFSKWLSKASNISLLDEILGLTLVDINQEVYVGSYRCDLVARDETTGLTVIVENQLGATDHDHLGKIITYASGLSASVIVWIVKEASEPHRAAIEWLNNNTNSDINFFLLEIHAYRIGDSLPAPKFEVVEKPNDFVKRSRTKIDTGELGKAEGERLAFWEQFNQVLVGRGKPFNVRKATKENWYDVALGTSEAHISINLINKAGEIVVDLNIHNNKQIFDRIYLDKDQIEERLGIDLKWDRMDANKAARVKASIVGLDFDDHSNYTELINQAIDTAVHMRDVFAPYFK